MRRGAEVPRRRTQRRVLRRVVPGAARGVAGVLTGVAAGGALFWCVLAFLPLLAEATEAVRSGSPAAERPLPVAVQQRLDALLPRYVEHGTVLITEDGQARYRFVRGGSAAGASGVGSTPLYLPASVIKLGTALAAIDLLGPRYRFPTELYLDARHERRRLIVKGGGDPMLTSEEWRKIGGRLAAQGSLRMPFDALVLDRSLYPATMHIPGAGDSLNPYDALPDALALNFNTVYLQVTAAGQVLSAEPQTPSVPLLAELGRGLPVGKHRINLSVHPGHRLAYQGQLLRALLELEGARFAASGFGGAIDEGRVPPEAVLLLRHRSSKPLTAVIEGMLAYSNNYIANQLVLRISLIDGTTLAETSLASSASSFSSLSSPLRRDREPQAHLERGAQRITQHLRRRLGVPGHALVLHEGSGLSRDTRASAEAVALLLEAFRPWKMLLPRHAPPRGLRSSLRGKTGTLRGVYTFAGFLDIAAQEGQPRRQYGLIVLLNQKKNTRQAILEAIQPLLETNTEENT